MTRIVELLEILHEISDLNPSSKSFLERTYEDRVCNILGLSDRIENKTTSDGVHVYKDTDGNRIGLRFNRVAEHGREIWRHYTGRDGFSYEWEMVNMGNIEYYVSISRKTFVVANEGDVRVVVLSDVDADELSSYERLLPFSRNAVTETVELLPDNSNAGKSRSSHGQRSLDEY